MAKIEEIGGLPQLTLQTKSTIAIVFVVAIIFIVLSFIYTGVDELQMGKAAVIINNVQRKATVETDAGLIFHLPFSMTEVYKYPVNDQVMSMQGKSEGGTIRVKTRDGSNVDFGAEIKYHINRSEEALKSLALSFGRDEDLKSVKELIKALARSDIREILGKLYIQEITSAAQRQEKTLVIQAMMNEQLEPYGVYVGNVSLSKPILNATYAQLIKDRKSADQELTNQGSAQDSALQKQEQAIATKTREKSTAVEEEIGRQNKRIIEAQSRAEQRIARADGDADKIRREGDKAYEVAKNEAQAFRAEGLSKAEGIRKMADAYENGGMALVREALAQKYLDAEISGRPFNLSNVVERLALEPATGAAAAKSAKGGTE